MKFCPYCGVVLTDGAAPFCAECGQALPTIGDVSQTDAKRRKSPQTHPDKPQKTPKLKKQRKKRKPKSQTETAPILDDGYDGYYDDILPEDNGQIKEGLEQGLIKRILLVAAGVLVVIALSVLAMYFL
jgi:hypothetical protein